MLICTFFGLVKGGQIGRWDGVSRDASLLWLDLRCENDGTGEADPSYKEEVETGSGGCHALDAI